MFLNSFQKLNCSSERKIELLHQYFNQSMKKIELEICTYNSTAYLKSRMDTMNYYSQYIDILVILYKKQGQSNYFAILLGWLSGKFPCILPQQIETFKHPSYSIESFQKFSISHSLFFIIDKLINNCKKSLGKVHEL